MPLTPPHRAADHDAMLRYFRTHAPLWYPRWTHVDDVVVTVERNFLGRFDAISLRYDITARIGKRVVLQVVRGQSRSKRHADSAMPKRVFHLTHYLVTHGFAKHILRPLAYDRAANLFLYEHLDGVTLESRICPNLISGKPGQSAVATRKYFRPVARLLKTLHTYKPINSLQRGTDDDEQTLVRSYLRLLRAHYPACVPGVQRILKEIHAHQPVHDAARSARRTLRVTHGDFHFANVVQHNNTLALIDFSDTGARNPLFDVGRFFAHAYFFFDRVYPRHHERLFAALQQDFLRTYFNNTMPTRTQRYALLYYAIVNIIQVMSIKSFDSDRAARKNMMRTYVYGLERFATTLLKNEYFLHTS